MPKNPLPVRFTWSTRPAAAWRPRVVLLEHGYRGLLAFSVVLFLLRFTRLALVVLVFGCLMWLVTVPRRLRRTMFATELFRMTRQITQSEAYEADVAQNRGLFFRVLQGDLKALLFATNYEFARRRVRPTKYIKIVFMEGLAGTAWFWPSMYDIDHVLVKWPPLFEVYHKDSKERLENQVRAFFGRPIMTNLQVHRRQLVARPEPVPIDSE